MYRVHLVQDNNFQIIKIGKKFHKNYKKQTMMNLKISKNIWLISRNFWLNKNKANKLNLLNEIVLLTKSKIILNLRNNIYNQRVDNNVTKQFK